MRKRATSRSNGRRRTAAARAACALLSLVLVGGELQAVPVPDPPQTISVCGTDFKDPGSVPEDFRMGIQKYNLRKWSDAVDLMDQALTQSPEDCQYVNTRARWTAPYLPNLYAGIALCAMQQLDDGRDRAAVTLASFDGLPDRVMRDYEKRCRVDVADEDRND